MRSRLAARGAFTLVELLVVLAIATALLGMAFATTGKQQRGADVKRQAELLQSTLMKARNMAIARRAVYAVVFNIQNEPGSSGAVLNNRSGGHWYRILGPAPDLRTYNSNYVTSSDLTDRIAYPGGNRANFVRFLDEIKTAWVDEPVVLPARRVRFLALGDTDEGPALRAYDPADAKNIRYGTDPSYPRPWFGYFDETTGTLWPWGGYKQGATYSGFFYQGVADPAIPDSRNPVNRPHMPVGEPRPLVNAEWLDAGIAFMPDGRAYGTEWNRGRRFYWSGAGFTGVQERTKIHFSATRNDTNSNAHGGLTTFSLKWGGGGIGDEVWDSTHDCPEVQHFVKHTGGWHITLAPDVSEDRTSFPSAKDALASMTPMYRVFVGKNGSTDVFPVKSDPGYLNGRKVWPTNPSDWLSMSAAGTNPVWQNCRVGWLHAPDTGVDTSKNLVKRGRPIVDVVNTEMLVKRVWWLDD